MQVPSEPVDAGFAVKEAPDVTSDLRRGLPSPGLSAQGMCGYGTRHWVRSCMSILDVTRVWM